MPLFTRENAREMGIKANFIRWHAPIPEPIIVERPAVPDDYKTVQLERVMKHINSIHDQLDANDVDPKGVLSLTAALDKLLVQARILRGESLPPVLKAPQTKRVTQNLPPPE